MTTVTLLKAPVIARPIEVLYGPIQPELLRNEVLADLLEATVRRDPHQVALIDGERQLSYGELDRQANVVASRLIEAGVGPGQIVGLWMPRGLELLVMQAGIAKTGAAWLPLDQDTPLERLQICMEDAQAVGVLSSASNAPALQAVGLTAWAAEVLLAPLAAPLLRRSNAQPEDPAYVIYTSGSTGKPKGILISQGSICHFLRSENAILGIQASDRVYQGFSVAFDMSFEEIWIAYLVGATLWIGPKDITADPEALPRMLAQQHISVLHAVPTLLALFSEDVPSLRLINLGGEMCPESLVERWSRPGRQIFNTYGPTEATVSASLARLVPGAPVTIGTPLPNYGLLVIEAELAAGATPTLLARGQTGELCIIGPGLADGYLGRPDLTREKFLENPWSTGYYDERLYRTGDLARIDADGRVVCLGRADDQVKIRGFRVELGEIEALLAQQPGVGTVAVLLRNDGGIDQLIAYLVPEGGLPVDDLPARLRKALQARLPAYMVPGRFELLDSMPRLTSGKIDRKALKARPLAMDTHGANLESDTPETPAESALFAALETLFPGQPIRRDADFFVDLGGHSFFAARLASALRADERFAHITVRDIYQQRRVGAIAQVLQATPQPTVQQAAWTPPSALARWRYGLAQAAVIAVGYTVMMDLMPVAEAQRWGAVLGYLALIGLAYSLGNYLLVASLKWLAIGRYRKRSEAMWTPFVWLSEGITSLYEGMAAPNFMSYLRGTPWLPLAFRGLGCKIGRGVYMDTTDITEFDCVTIGDHSELNAGACPQTHLFEDRVMKIDQVLIGERVYMGPRSAVLYSAEVGNGARLGPLTLVMKGECIPAYSSWLGCPAAPARG